jgi:hypothetical protein
VLAAKKKSLADQHYPSRFPAILDRMGHCEGCVNTAPDGFSLLVQDLQGNIRIDAWDRDNERIDAHNVAAHQLQTCRVIYVRHACNCCQEKKYNQRPDYDATLDLNTDMSVACSEAAAASGM